MYSLYSWSAGRRYAASAIGTLLATLLLVTLFADAQPTNIALLFLLVVLVCAAALGLGPAILAAGLAFLAFNFFFVPPLHTLFVSNPQDVLRLATFLVVAVIGGSLAGRLRERAEAAARSASELAALYGLSQTISAEVDLDRILPLVAQTATQLLNVPACSVLLYDEGGKLIERATYGTPPPEPARRVDSFLRSGPRVLGVLRITQPAVNDLFTQAQQGQLDTIASQVVLVLERAELAGAASQVRVLAESERMKSMLLSSVSHDLRTPLAVIKGSVTNLLDESVAWDAPSRRELLHAVDEETDRLNRLVGNLLEMTRIEAGALHLTRSSQDIGEVIAAVVERLRPQLASRPLQIELPPDLPPVQISYTQIDQVLTNLIENAAKYTPAGTAITVQAAATAEDVQVEVSDQGPGIPEGMRTRIFEKFVRAIGPERHADGAGLGLAICKGIIEAHGGKIWAENRDGGGARFVFTLPAHAPASPAAAALEPVSTQEDQS